MSNVLCIIQARMGSTRLPGKVLMSVGGSSLLQIAYTKSLECFFDSVVVSFPATMENLPIDFWCSTNMVPRVRWHGDENDVLGRFFDVVSLYNLAPDDVVYRFTPDDWRRDVDAMIRVANGESGIPVEIGGEACTFAQLKEWHETVTDPFLREHIGHLITPNPVAPPDDGLPWSVDTAEQLAQINEFLAVKA